ncbi:MAG TPA: hypothetical protein VHL12_03695 [Gemmatimonadaceae bacterium]|jgi:hypothetical protein|nr:hypothetical protein [Gemmatimonadaceae bacterium]
MSHLSEEQLDHLIDQERTRVQAPLNEWRTIAARAREEGLIRGSAEGSSWRGTRPWMQAAAAIVLLAGGIAIGRTTAAIPGSSTDQAEQPAMATAAPVSNSGPITQVGGTTFASVDEASATLERALSDYQRASAFIAANVSGPTTIDSSRIYSARLAALDQVGNAMEGALRTAPHDPVINQYYLATMGARVATQQLAARPVGLRLKGF